MERNGVGQPDSR